MRKNLTLIGLLIVIAGGAYVALFQWDAVKSLWTKNVKGYKPAKTPQEAVDYFKKAVEDGDFEAAALYCHGEHQNQMTKLQDKAKELREAIENIRTTMDNEGIVSDKARFALLIHDPLPPEMKFKNVAEEKDGKSSVTVYLDAPDSVIKVGRAMQNDWGFEPKMVNVMVQNVNPAGMEIEIKKVGEGDDAQWKLVFPKIPDESVDFFNQNATNYVNGINSVKSRAKNDASVQEKKGFEDALRKALQDAG